MYRVYQELNLINGKTYTGVTGQGMEYRGSGIALKKAQERYGYTNFAQTTLMETDDLELALFVEELMVDEDAVKRRDNYNLVVGGGYPPRKPKETYRRGYKNPEHSKRQRGKNAGSVARSRKVVADWKEFESVRQAARHFGLSHAIIIKRIKMGLDGYYYVVNREFQIPST